MRCPYASAPRKLLSFLLMACAPFAHAGVMAGSATIEIVPAAPAANANVEVVSSRPPPNTCLYFTVAPTVDLTARTITVTAYGTDGLVSPCPAYYQSPQVDAIGPLPRGTYQVTYSLCADNAPPGEPPCSLLGVEDLLVGGGDPVEVPASSSIALAAMILLLVTLGRAALQRRS